MNLLAFRERNPGFIERFVLEEFTFSYSPKVFPASLTHVDARSAHIFEKFIPSPFVFQVVNNLLD